MECFPRGSISIWYGVFLGENLKDRKVYEEEKAKAEEEKRFIPDDKEQSARFIEMAGRIRLNSDEPFERAHNVILKRQKPTKV